MKIFLKYFSVYRHRFHQDEAMGEYPNFASVRDVFFSHFQEREEAEKCLRFTRFAVNCEYVPVESTLKEGDELVFLPPVSGG